MGGRSKHWRLTHRRRAAAREGGRADGGATPTPAGTGASGSGSGADRGAGTEGVARAALHVTAYGPGQHVERAVGDVAEVKALMEAHAVTWVDVAGTDDPALVESVTSAFGVHRLAVEDILNDHQRPKVEPYADHLFVVMRMVHVLPDGMPDNEQVSIVLGPGFVLTFQGGKPGDSFGPVRERLRSVASRLRGRGADALFQALISAIVESVFPALESIGDRIEALEDEVLDRPRPVTMTQIQDIKRALLQLRRIAFPAREATANLHRDPNSLIQDETRIYLRDVHDHAVQTLDLVETYRELAVGLSELYLSSVSNRLNEVMKVLTIISTIFIPLSFVASVYGMNFDPAASRWNMPELGWALGYPMALGIMAIVGLALVAFFVHKGWLSVLGPGRSDER